MSSYFVGKTPKGIWRVMKEVWKDGKRKQATVPPTAYLALGIDPTSNEEQVKKRVKQLNSEKRIEHEQAVEAAKRVAKIGFYEDTFFPQEYVDAFTEKVRIDTAGSESHLLRLYSHFKFIQDMVLKLKITPKDYSDKAGHFYHYLKEKQASVDYAKKLIQMLNLWGRFVARRQGTFFEPVPMPPRKMKGAIAKAQRTKKGVRRESERLTLDMFKTLRPKLTLEEGNWIHCSFWLGLRPIEVDQLTELPELEVILNEDGKTRVLVVFQTKLEGEIEEEGYKYIPLLYPEQDEAVELLKSRIVKRPNPKKLKLLSGHAIDVYCGRKGFADLMQSLGQRIEDSSVWLGHKDIRTTRKHYKDRSNVSFTPVKKSHLKIVKD